MAFYASPNTTIIPGPFGTFTKVSHNNGMVNNITNHSLPVLVAGGVGVGVGLGQRRTKVTQVVHPSYVTPVVHQVPNHHYSYTTPSQVSYQAQDTITEQYYCPALRLSQKFTFKLPEEIHQITDKLIYGGQVYNRTSNHIGNSVKYFRHPDLNTCFIYNEDRKVLQLSEEYVCTRDGRHQDFRFDLPNGSNNGELYQIKDTLIYRGEQFYRNSRNIESSKFKYHRDVKVSGIFDVDTNRIY
jgi:hypothetical protein